MNRIQNNDNGGNGHQHTKDLKAEIEKTRHRLDETVDELAEKLDPREHISSAYDWVKDQVGSVDPETVKACGRQSAKFAKENPLPLLFGALAVASIFLPKPNFRGSRDGTERDRNDLPRPMHPTVSPYRQSAESWDRSLNGQYPGPADESSDESMLEKAEAKSREIGNTIAERTDEAQKSVVDTFHTAKAKVTDAAKAARDQTTKAVQRTKERAERGRDEYPICLAAGAAALGLFAAIILPRTRKEDELMGESSDQMIDRMKDKTREKMEDEGLTIDNLQEKTEEAIEDAADKAEEKVSA